MKYALPLFALTLFASGAWLVIAFSSPILILVGCFYIFEAFKLMADSVNISDTDEEKS